MKPQFLMLFFCLASLFSFGQSAATFSKEDVLEDLKTLHESLKEAHYNVYAYISEKEFNDTYFQLRSNIEKDSLSAMETTTLFQQLISTVNNGHTEIDFPAQSYGVYAYAGGTIFPLEIAFENGKSLVRKNFSDDSSIAIGSEIISINGISMEDILAKIYPQVSAERPYFKNVKIELYSFPRYYWQVFGKQDDFVVEIRTDETVTTHTCKAVNLIEGYEMKRNEVANAKMELKFFEKSAYLNPGNFSGDEEKFQQFIDSAFVAIKEEGSKNLIVDLRNNLGGNDSFSDYLVSYFADKPFMWNSSFTLKTSKFLKNHIRQHSDTTSTFNQKILSHKDGEIYDYTFDAYQPQPEPKRFTGKVYVLINRQSHSQAAVTAAQIQDYKFGTLVGEETGDYPSLYASQFQYNLPNTGIPVKVSKGYIVRVNGSTKEQGVIPDVYIRDQLLDENDEILTILLKLIDK
ncbi:S41 family peptidase [Flagellimonas iocasae]|uniref:S41 family peptidase n=1 Tax=Flagellimonas iocasae TaxID=2055905 RepID=A0ABW4XUU7_9FLAO